MKHTPGPWKLNIDTVCIRNGVQVQPVTHHMDSQGMADARLIASAPELLEALKAVRCFYENAKHLSGDEDAILEEVRAAIAKAEGV